MSSATIRWGAVIVALGAVVATAHGLFEVAAAARVPVGMAWLFPLVTDGLALVSYASTTRLSGAACRYAWAIVVLAAGLSGLAQAVYLATDLTSDGTGAVVLVLPAALRFGIGAWPAIAAALVAHLLYLLAPSRAALDPPLAEPSTPELPVDGPAPGAAPARDVVAPPQEQHPTPPPGEEPDVDDDHAVIAWALDRLRRGEHAGAGTLHNQLGVAKKRAERLAAAARQQAADEHRLRAVR